MNRSLFLNFIMAAVVLVSVGSLAIPALADGTLSITNKTIDAPVMVQVKLGTSLDDAVDVTSQTLAKNQTLNLDATNLQYFWRRESNPGTGDGKFTDWQRVDSSSSDRSISF